jgi:Sigma-70, region 4
VLLQQLLLPAVMDLPVRQRAVLVLRYFEDLSVEQTADALACSTGTVKSQTHHALNKLREAPRPHRPPAVRSRPSAPPCRRSGGPCRRNRGRLRPRLGWTGQSEPHSEPHCRGRTEDGAGHAGTGEARELQAGGRKTQRRTELSGERDGPGRQSGNPSGVWFWTKERTCVFIRVDWADAKPASAAPAHLEGYPGLYRTLDNEVRAIYAPVAPGTNDAHPRGGWVVLTASASVPRKRSCA